MSAEGISQTVCDLLCGLHNLDVKSAVVINND